jgi:hypothetical protein
VRRGEWTKTGIHDQFVGSDIHGATLGKGPHAGRPLTPVNPEVLEHRNA